MKILHTADIHIGVENYGKIDPETRTSTRLSDFLRSFDEIVSFAIQETVDLVIIAGDAYKSRNPSQWLPIEEDSQKLPIYSLYIAYI